VVIEKDQWNAPVTHFNPDLAVRAHYSFERPPEETSTKKKGKEKKPKHKLEPKSSNDAADQKPQTQAVETLPLKTESKQEPPPANSLFKDESPLKRSNELNKIFNYFRSRPDVCRRAISIPKNSYQRLNQRRADRVRHQIAREESLKTNEMLKMRIQGAVVYYRKEIDRQRKRELSKKPVIEVRNESDASDASVRQKKIETPAEGPTPGKRIKLKADEPPAQEKKAHMLDIQVPRIAACYSLNTASVDVLAPDMAKEATTSAAATGSTHGSTDTNSANVCTFYNDVVKNMNTLVSKKMQDIDLALQRESKIIPSPNEEILCIIKWTNFLAAFESGFVFIWDVQMKTHNFLAATTTNLMPSVCGAIAVVNTKFAPDPQALPLMARMLMNSMRNEKTNRLAVVMQGRQSFWLVKGFLRHMQGNACTKPTPMTHPLLTKKINVLCSLLVKQRVRENEKKTLGDGSGAPYEVLAGDVSPQTSLLMKNRSRDLKRKSQADERLLPSGPSMTKSSKPSAGGYPIAASVATSTTSAFASSSGKSTPVCTAKTNSASTKNKSSATGIRSNIEFRKVNHNDVDELQIPELHQTDHRWVVLDIFDDFSHIFVPSFSDMISLTRIHSVMQVAEERQKVVKLQFFPNAPYDAFVTPSSKKKIYFGPLSLDMPPPVLVLLQSVDRKMMLREVYQREHSIPVQRHRRSMAFWVLQINGQVHFEIDTESTAKLAAQQKNAIGTPPGLNVLKIPSQLSVEIEKNQDEVPPVVVIDSDEEDDDGERQLVIDEQDDEQAETDVKQEVERTGFTIQTLPSSGALQITISDSAETSSHPAKDVNTCHFSGGFMPFIANVPAKFGETAPTTQFLTPQVQVTTSQSGPETLTSSSSSHLPASKSAYPKINESLQELFSSGVPPGGITITKVDSQEKTLPNETVQVVKNKKSIAITGIHKQVTKAAYHRPLQL